MNKSKTFATVALPLIAISSMLPAARNSSRNMGCEPTPPAACNQESCCRTYCMGPENYGVNAAVNPRTCNGDWVINIEGLYWNAHQEGLEYAIFNDQLANNWQNNLTYIDAEVQSPNFKWDFGFKAGIGYNTTCDGWDLRANWTWYRGKAHSEIEAETDDNRILIALLSNFGNVTLFPLATEASADWRLQLNLVDFELGRKFWNSKRLNLRPFIGLRYASIKQDYTVQYRGGTFTTRVDTSSNAQNDTIDMDNDFHGAGIRAGLNSIYNLGCGWGVYGNLAFSIVYGRFDIDIDEQTRDVTAPHTKNKFTELEHGFRANRYMADLALGVQWTSLFCDCQYGFTVALGWENHIFINQNQLYRINHEQDSETNDFTPSINQLRGDLDTQGWTLSVSFDF